MSVEKRYISPNEFMRDTWRLAAKVVESGWRPDVLIALWRGGATVGIGLHEFFKTIGWDIEHFPVKCRSYTGIGENPGKVVFDSPETVFSKIPAGGRVLVVDDVFDTGKTAEAVREAVDARGVEMRLACVYWKPGKNTTSLEPDYFTESLGDGWIVFPHEIQGLLHDEISQKDEVLAAIINPLMRNKR